MKCDTSPCSQDTPHLFGESRTTHTEDYSYGVGRTWNKSSVRREWAETSQESLCDEGEQEMNVKEREEELGQAEEMV